MRIWPRKRAPQGTAPDCVRDVRPGAAVRDTRLIDSGAAIARRTAWLLEHEAPDAKSSDENKAFCMALTAETEQLLPVLRRYGFSTLEKLPL